jgi:hypothetical protein
MTAGSESVLTILQVWTAGQVIGLIHDIPTCNDLVHRIEEEALATIKKTQSLIVDKQPEPDIVGKPMGDESANPNNKGKGPGEAQIYGIEKAKL